MALPVLITGLDYEEHGDCSELKRQIHIEKQGLKYIAKAFKNYDFVPINNGRFIYKRLLKDIEKYKKSRNGFYSGYKAELVFVQKCKV